MKFDSARLVVQLIVALIAVLMTRVDSAPITVIKGTPFLFNKFDYPVDPNRGAQLSPSFQAANGPLGANLVAYFGTGNL